MEGKESDDEKKRRVCFELTKNLMHLLEPTSTGDEQLQMSQSVRNLDEDLFTDIENKIKAIVQREEAPHEHLDASVLGADASVSANVSTSASDSDNANAATFSVGNKETLVDAVTPTNASKHGAATDGSSGASSTQAQEPLVDTVAPDSDSSRHAVMDGSSGDFSAQIQKPAVDAVMPVGSASRDAATDGSSGASSTQAQKPLVNTVAPDSASSLHAVTDGSSGEFSTQVQQPAVDAVMPIGSASRDAATDGINGSSSTQAQKPLVDTVAPDSASLRHAATDGSSGEFSAQVQQPVVDAVMPVGSASRDAATNGINGSSSTQAQKPLVDANVAESHSLDVVDKSPVVTVQCTDQITTGNGGVVIDMGNQKKSSNANESHQSQFPSASTSSTASPYPRAVFGSSRGAQLDADAKKIVEDIVTTEESAFGSDDDDIPEKMIAAMTQDGKQKSRELISSQLSEDSALDEIAKPTKEHEEEGEEEETEEVTAVRGLQQSMMERAEAEDDKENAPSTSTIQRYAHLFASDDESEVNLTRKEKGPLKLGPVNGIKSNDRPINGIKLSELRSQSAYTPANPLMPDPNHKKQTVLTDQFSRVLGSKPSSSLLQQQKVAQNASALGNAPQRPPQPHESTINKSTSAATPSNAPFQPLSENVNSASTQLGGGGGGGSSPSKNGTGNSPSKRNGKRPYKFTPPKMSSIDMELPIVKKAAAPIKKSKNSLTALPVKLGNKICEFCFKPFLGRQKLLTPREHVITGSCDFVKQNCVSIGVDKTCNQCEKSFHYNKSMYEEIISHFSEENHEIVCYVCGLRFQFSEIFSHMSNEIANYFQPGVPCSKCKTVLNTASDFYDHLKIYHSAKEINASVFNRFLYDSHPHYNFLLVSLMLTHSSKKV